MKNVIAAITLSFAVSWQASAISYDAGTDGMTAPSGASFSSVGGSLALKTVAGVVGLGIGGGASGNEIDLGQMLSVSFLGSPQMISSMSLAFLYDGPEFGDNREIAAIRVGGTEYRLQATGSTTATWTGFGGNASVVNLNPAIDPGGAGVWKITNPFGDLLVSGFDLYPISSNPRGNESDFSLKSFETTTRRVPDAGSTLALLGLGFTGLIGLRRRIVS